MTTASQSSSRTVLDPIEVESARIALGRFEDESAPLPPIDGIFVHQHPGGYEPRHHELWARLCDRQRMHLREHASALWTQGAGDLNLDQQHVPDVIEVSRRLRALTGWEIRPVTGYMPPRAFFACLAQRIMPVTVTVRDPQQEGYLPEPDAFHDIFGHAPLCAVPQVAQLMEDFGYAGLRASVKEREQLTRVFWFTIEFGLIREGGKVRLLGAGLVSSPDESRSSIESANVSRLPFDGEMVAHTPFVIDQLQDQLFVLNDLSEIDQWLAHLRDHAEPCTGACGCKGRGSCGSHGARAATAAGASTSAHGADPIELLGVDHVRMYVGNALQARAYYSSHFGFTADQFSDLTTGNRDEATHLMVQGDIRLALTSGLTTLHPASQEVARYGDGVKDIAFTVRDAEAAYRQALRNGATSAYEPRESRKGSDLVVTAGIEAFGRVVHSFVSRRGACANEHGLVGRTFDPTYEPVVNEPSNETNRQRSCGLRALDHCVANVRLGEMNRWVDWYSEVLGFKLFKHFDDKDISTEYSALMSKVMDSAHGRNIVKIPINEPASGRRKSQVQEFLDWHDGTPGVQHLAFRTGDALATVRELRRRGVSFLGLPATYYERVWERVEGALGRPIEEPHALVQSLGLLLDSDDEGYLLQVFTKPVQDRPTLFIEIIGRKGATGFGKGNFKALFEALELEQERRGNL